MPDNPFQDPRRYFGFKSCGRCSSAPCNRLRFGGVFPGKLLLAPARMFSPTHADCPFNPQSWTEIEALLSDMPLQDLNDLLEEAIVDLSPADQIGFDHRSYIDSFDDVDGRMRLLRELWENNSIFVLRIPGALKTDAKMKTWLRANETLPEYLKRPEKEAEDTAAALTDEMTEEKPVSLSNPRWEHADAGRKKKTPEKASEADSVILMVDVKGVDDGAAVTFDLFDTGVNPPQRFDSASGKVEKGIGKGEWKVKLPDGVELEKMKIEFEASAGGKTSVKREVKVLVKEFEYSY